MNANLIEIMVTNHTRDQSTPSYAGKGCAAAAQRLARPVLSFLATEVDLKTEAIC